MAILRPSSDLITGGWTSTDASLSAAIDETTYSDTDYISTSTAGDIARVSLGTYTTSAGTHSLKYRAASPEADRGLIARVLELGQPPAIILKRDVWKSQPQVPVGLNDASLIVADLGQNRLVNTGSPPTTNTTTPIVTRFGRASGVTAYLKQKYSIPPITIGTGDFTLIFDVDISAKGQYNYIFGVSYDYFAAMLGHNSIGDRVGMLMPGMVLIDSGLTAPLGRCVGAFVRRNGAITFYLNNQTSSPIAAAQNVSAFNEFAINSYSTSAVNGFSSGNYRLMGIKPGAWTDSQAKAFIDNSWQVFRKKSRPIFIDAPKVIATHTKTYTELGTTPADQTLTLSSGEAASITNGAELALEVEST